MKVEENLKFSDKSNKNREIIIEVIESYVLGKDKNHLQDILGASASFSLKEITDMS